MCSPVCGPYSPASGLDSLQPYMQPCSSPVAALCGLWVGVPHTSVPRAAILLLYSLALHPRVHSIYAGVPYCSSPWLAMEHGTNATELFALVGGDRYGPPAKAAPRASSNLPQPYILYAIHASQRINLGTTAHAGQHS